MGTRCEQDSLHQTLALEKGHICLVRFEVSGCCVRTEVTTTVAEDGWGELPLADRGHGGGSE